MDYNCIEKISKFCNANALALKNVTQDPEGKEYCAHTFTIQDKLIKFRASKITPTKIGQFVTFWKRNNQEITIPFDLADEIDYYMVFCQKDNQAGVFIFPRTAFYQNGYLSKDGKGGKRAIRVYPRWDHPNSIIALKTQSWQLPYFSDMNDGVTVKELFI